MAFSPKFLCLFIVLITLSLSLQTYARDIQFFSKVTRNRDDQATTTNNNPNTYFNTKNDEFVHLNKQEEPVEQPAFIPQNTETGYGLYGHETGLNPPSTTTTKSHNMDKNNYENKQYENFNNNNYDENSFNFNKNNKNNYDDNNFNFDKNNNYDENNFDFNKNNNYDESNFNFNKNNNNNYENFNNYYKNINENHEKNYAPELKGLSGTSKYFANNNNNGESKYYGAGYNGGMEKQGMSDTRFLENGKYFYDVNAQKNFDADNNYMSNNYNNNYDNNGYYGNKENKYEEYYNNNNNKNNFYGGNGMQGYQNEVPEEEFDFDQP